MLKKNNKEKALKEFNENKTESVFNIILIYQTKY